MQALQHLPAAHNLQQQIPLLQRSRRCLSVQCKASTSDKQATQDAVVVSRVSNSGGSRKAFSQVFCKLAATQVSPVQGIMPEQLVKAQVMTLHPVRLKCKPNFGGSVPAAVIAAPTSPRPRPSQAFCKIAGIQVSPVQEITPEQLANAPYPAYQPPLSQGVVVQQKRPYWQDRTWTDTDVGYLSFFAAMHVIALVGAPLTFSWDALEVMLGGYALTGMLGVSMSYHRQLSHKSFRTPKWLEYFLAYCGALAFEGDPIEWSKNHRWHHQNSDSPADRHSPRDGLWHAHMGWLFDESLTNTRLDPKGNNKDSLSAPWFYKESPEFYGWLRETYMYHMLGQGVFFAVWGGLPYFIWGFVVRVLFTMHMTWLVNSAVHVWGSRDYETDDDSRNNMLVALLVFGDGHHNNHHCFPASAAHGLEWWEVDFSYYMIRLLEMVGLAWDVRRPTEEQKAKYRVARSSS